MPRPIVYLDFETLTTRNLLEVGAHNYLTDPMGVILCLAYAVDDGPVCLWWPGCSDPEWSQRPGHYDLYAWNAGFDRRVVQHLTDWPVPELKHWHDPSAWAAATALPFSLDRCGQVAGLEAEGLAKAAKRGVELIRTANRGKLTRDTFIEMCEYCMQDVVALRALSKRLAPLCEYERRIWELDYAINNRGVAVDTAMVARAIAVDSEHRTRISEQARMFTKDALANINSRKQVIEYLGGEIYDFKRQYLIDTLAKGDISDHAAEIIKLRLESGRSSASKYKKLLDLTCDDGRARNLFFYHGASTGRWAGRGFQPHNLPRGVKGVPVDAYCDALARGASYDELAALYPSAGDALISCIRGALVGDPGLVVSDFSAIEARVLAWLAGQEDVLEVFRGHGKIYETAAAKIYGVPVEEISKEDPRRQIGKVAVLALGYQGGVGAFQNMAANYGVEVPDDEAQVIVQEWRAANEHIVHWWYDLERAAKRAIQRRGMERLGTLIFSHERGFLLITLPSGRRLSYPFARLKQIEKWGKQRIQIHYMTVCQKGRKWVETETYGGKLAENIVQAVARDLLAEAMLRIDAAGFEIVLHVHDEVVVEDDEEAVDEITRLMELPPAWADGLPLRAETFFARRYRK